MDELPIDSIKEIFDVMVVKDPKSYFLVINASGKKLEGESLKKVTEIKPLLESVCKSRTKDIGILTWKIIIF